jgi:YtkA-like
VPALVCGSSWGVYAAMRTYSAIFALLLLVSGCARSTRTPGSIAVDAKFVPRIARSGQGIVAVNLSDSAARPVTGAHITAEGNMSHPGMAPVFADCKEREPGRYQADLDLGMRGSWVILLEITLANGEKIERRMGVEVKAD